MMKPISWIEELLAGLPPALEQPPSGDTADLAHFDPDRDDLDDTINLIWSLADNDRQYYGRCAEALEWLDNTVGLDFNDLQARWKQIPVIPVPKHVSDKYDLDEPRGLFGFLDQIKRAYIVGADLAAIALCRATTELLIRNHYAADIPGAQITRGPGSTRLTWLIERVQDRPEFKFLCNFNLVKKVAEANEILHKPNATDIEHRDYAHGVVQGWIGVLEEMIHRAPDPRATGAGC
jgi:hypothetical protein